MLKMVMVAVSSIVSFAEKNYGRHMNLVDNAKDKLVRAVILAEYGWDIREVVKIVALNSDAEKEHAKEVREAQWQALAAQVLDTTFALTNEKLKLNAAQVQQGYKATYFNEGGKTIKVPKYDNVYAFQRLEALPLANAILLKQGKPLITEIPCYIVEYANEFERMEDCAAENIRKNLGVKDPNMFHWPTLLKIASEYHRANPGAGRSDIQRLIAPAGTKGATRKSQKIWPILVLDSRFPALKIVDSILSMPINDKGVDTGNEKLKAIDEDTFLKPLVEGTSPTLDEDNEERASRNAELVDPATENDVAEFFSNPFTAVRPKGMLSKKVLNNLLQTCTSIQTRGIIKAILKGDDNGVKKYDAIAADTNEMCVAAGLVPTDAVKSTVAPESAEVPA